MTTTITPLGDVITQHIGNLQPHNQEGWIRLVRRGRVFVGDTVADDQLLRCLVGRGAFPIDQYDHWLDVVGQHGYGFESPYEEEHA